MTSIRDDRGATAVEYAVLLFFVGLTMFVGVAVLNSALASAFTAVADEVAGAPAAPAAPVTPVTPVTPVAPEGGDAGGSGDAGDAGNSSDRGEAGGGGDGASAPDSPGSIEGASSARGQLRVSWTAPSSDGGSPVLSYDVRIDDRSGKTTCASSFKESDSQTALAGSSRVSFDALAGSAYCVQVRAHNAEGDSAWVEAGPFVVLAPAEPGEPRSLSGQSTTRGELVVTWSSPADDGGSAITGYDVEIDDRSGAGQCSTRFDDSDDTTTSGTSARFTGLTGSAYCVRVRASNSVGDSGWVEAGVIAMASSTPGAPQSLERTSVTKYSVVLAWEAPSRDGAAKVTDYTVEYRQSGASSWTLFDDQVRTATSASVTGLSKGTRYDFRVAAVNAAGQGDYSDVLTVSTDR